MSANPIKLINMLSFDRDTLVLLGHDVIRLLLLITIPGKLNL